ncbi:MutS-related protein [Pedobacter hiemivivus]|uniref:DNA mismatch repair protein n=1 Tax=Pedobacter hiemivivus TaxID=2530454 RepID=A0A4R0NJB3_9SPHI|nr:DNA mismatch repair protein [Pedobacter hiemivivus]TCC99502.1 DNA mismatch repair protein [Pedobacter hiemivivus]
MSFIADKQTLEDLNLLSKYRSNSVYSIFNVVHTRGGRKILDEMFDFPLTNVEAINTRSSIFEAFGRLEFLFPLNGQAFEVMEDYLSSAEGKDAMDIFKLKALAFVGLDKEYREIQAGFYETVKLLNIFRDFLYRLDPEAMPAVYWKEIASVKAIFKDYRLAWLLLANGAKDLSGLKIAKYDAVLRFTFREEMKQICSLIYKTDTYMAVGNVGRLSGFAYAKALAKDRYIIRLEGLCHPELKNPVSNDITLSADSNVLFLTGANMAGKSTTMKAFGIAIYLAHMGFPVAATAMEFSVKDGLYTSINVPDNLNLGLSHFYAEVLRVKRVAEEVGDSKNMVVIFDELFKGTNVKDAYDATLSVTKAFSAHRNCAFIISTHIIEVGEALGAVCDNLQFVYLPTVMDGLKPSYTYRLQQGITNDRHGMMIINNERILETIKGTLKQ